MDSLYFLIPLALIFTGLAIKFLFWAVNSGQYDDLDTEAHRILFDDDIEGVGVETKPVAANSKSDSK